MERVNHTWRWTAKRAVFSLLRARQPVRLFEAVDPEAGGRTRILHIGDAFRGRPFIENMLGHHPTPFPLGHALVGPWTGRLSVPGVEHDLQLVEINRLHASRWRRAGFLVIPEWVMFGRSVEPDETLRYAAASKALRREIRAVREAGLQTAVSRSRSDFDLYYARMYLPHVTRRFGEGRITKPRRKLLDDFRRGIVLFVLADGKPIAGAIARVNGDTVSMTSVGVLDGSHEHLRTHVSAALDLGLHEWAAARGKRTIDVGHTRPFLEDGIFRNKRRWLMAVSPDQDGVMGMALAWRAADEKIGAVLARFPFVYESARGLGALALHRSEHPIDEDEAASIWRRRWTAGLVQLTVVCPSGVRERTLSWARAAYGPALQLCTDLATARSLCLGEP